jgi:Tfp pilus assembly protein PilF
VKKLTYILIVPVILSGMSLQAQSAKQYVKAGEDFAKAMNFADAIDQYSKAIELDPDYDKAYFNRATAYANVGDHEHAAMDFNRAIVFDEKEAELYYFSGR